MKNFNIPEKWCIKPKDINEINIIFDFEGIGKCQDSKDLIYYQHYPPFLHNICTASRIIKPGYTEITLEQFMFITSRDQKEIIKDKILKFNI